VTKRYEQIASTIRVVDRLSREWTGKVPGAGDPTHTPWMPFPRYDFVSLLTDAVAEAEGDRFLEIGCGPGPYMMLAESIFDLDVQGIERVPEYVAQARQTGLLVHEADAGEWKGYGDYDILWFNRPFRDREAQRALEDLVWSEMRPGAVVMCANLENKPPPSWYMVMEDWEVRRGVWQKLPFRVA
jgi:trans-aconitate methyltransferase